MNRLREAFPDAVIGLSDHTIGSEAAVVATVLGPQRLVSHMRLGDVAPLYATSGGKVILAYLSPELQEQYLSRVAFVRATPTTIHSAQALREHVDVVGSG